jgi:hypothetical protein
VLLGQDRGNAAVLLASLAGPLAPSVERRLVGLVAHRLARALGPVA